MSDARHQYFGQNILYPCQNDQLDDSSGKENSILRLLFTAVQALSLDMQEYI